MFQIESRWPASARWRKVTASLHREKYPFNSETQELEFIGILNALDAMEAMKRANAGEFRIVGGMLDVIQERRL
jgi:hypothetical protein